MRNRLLLALTFSFAGVLPTAAHAQVVAYHDQTGAQHQAQFNTLSAAGYRMITLSMYDSPTSPLYAAVWVHRSGPGWVGFHGVDATTYQNLFNTWAPQGYIPKLLCANGSGSSIRFAGVFEYDPTPFFAAHNLTASAFDTQCGSARDQGYRLIMGTIYGSAAAPLYAGVWRRNDENISWNYARSGDAASYQLHFNAYASAWVRPVHVTLSSFGDYLSIWNDNQLTGGWSAAHDLTSAGYQTAFTSQWNAGSYPICVQAGGVGAATRFAAIFAPAETVAGRSFTVTGTAVPELASFDTYMQQLMQGDAVRAAALAVIKDGRLMLARGYTWAEAGYPVTQPTSLFRIASASKSLTSIAVHQAMARSLFGLVNDSRTMLSFFPAIAPLDSRTNNITLLHLLTHRGGWDINALGFDPLFRDVPVNSYAGGTLPVSKDEIYQYMTTGQLLQFPPGSANPVYSNYGFMMLGKVLERLNTGMTYAQVMDRDVFTPLGLTRPQLGGSLLSQAAAGEVRYHPVTPYIGTSVITAAQPWVAGQYGTWNQGNLDANGGWIMAAPDYAKVLASFSLGDQNPLLDTAWTNHMWSTVAGSPSNLLRGWWKTSVQSNGQTKTLRHHNGGLPGTATFCCVRSDNVGFCVFLNRDHWLGDVPLGTDLSALADAVTQWPNHDLFPSVGIPSIRSHVTGTFTSYGAGCAGSAGTPSQTGTGTPETSYAFGLRVANAPAGSLGVLFLGFSRTSYQGVPLPLPLPGAPGCSLLASLDLVLSANINRAGSGLVSVPLPADPSLIGGHLYSQYGVVDPTANSLGLSFSNGLDTRVGGWR